jgi:hypothetical protein
MELADFCEIVENVKSLNDKLSHLGLEIILGEKKANIVPQLRKSDKKGIGKYWDAINEIANSRGITKAQAREIHKKANAKANGKANVRVSEALTKYWNAVRTVQAEKNISATEARKIVKEQTIKVEEQIQAQE